MKRWKKWTLGILLSVSVGLGVLFAVMWPRLQILSGTEGLSGAQAGIPAAAASVGLAVPGEHDWTAWRGARNDGRSTVTGIRTDWSNGLRKLWEVDFLCQGGATTSWSAPVVRGNRLVVPGRDERQDLLFGLDPESGKLLWVGAYPAEARTAHGPGPRATPYIDDTRVYTFGRSGALACWDIEDGKLLWRQNVSAFGGEEPRWGHASSPLVVGDRVIVQAGGTARTIAFDKTSGDLAWKSGHGAAGYAALSTLEDGHRTQLVVFHGKGLAGLDAADGTILWDLPWETPYDVHATTPVVTERGVLITSGYGRGAQLVEVESAVARVAWETQALAAQHSDPFVIDGHIYGYSGDSSQNRGAFKCLDLASGRELWSSNEIGWGTCTWVDGHLLCQDIHGNLALVRPDPAGLKVVARLEDALGETRGPVWTIPVVANGRLFLRFKQKLVCYDLAGES
jgi:outer membrane protein assembly factor BamB